MFPNVFRQHNDNLNDLLYEFSVKQKSSRDASLSTFLTYKSMKIILFSSSHMIRTQFRICISHLAFVLVCVRATPLHNVRRTLEIGSIRAQMLIRTNGYSSKGINLRNVNVSPTYAEIKKNSSVRLVVAHLFCLTCVYVCVCVFTVISICIHIWWIGGSESAKSKYSFMYIWAVTTWRNVKICKRKRYEIDHSRHIKMINLHRNTNECFGCCFFFFFE